MKGMALILSLLLVLLLTLFSFVMVLLAGSYYGSTKNLIELENARLMCDSVSTDFIQEHNEGTDLRLFFDPGRWVQLQMQPRIKHGYEINASLEQPWSPVQGNLLSVVARKGRFESRQSLWVRQMRLEDFALYSDRPQILNHDSLFDGLVFVRTLKLQNPMVRFRDRVYGTVNPPENASFRKLNLQQLNLPALKDLISIETMREDALTNGLIISTEDPLLWSGEFYRVRLDDLQLEKNGDAWKVSYAGMLLGETAGTHLFFNAPVRIVQSDVIPEYPPYSAPVVPLLMSSVAGIHIESSLHRFRGPDAVHPVALLSAGSIHVDSSISDAAVIDALIVALGSETVAGNEFSLIVDPGSTEATEIQKATFGEEVSHSVFLLEEQKKVELMQALEAGERLLWFREPVAVTAAVKIPDTVSQVHFEASCSVFSALPSFPFVQILEGSKQWH